MKKKISIVVIRIIPEINGHTHCWAKRIDLTVIDRYALENFVFQCIPINNRQAGLWESLYQNNTVVVQQVTRKTEELEKLVLL